MLYNLTAILHSEGRIGLKEGQNCCYSFLKWARWLSRSSKIWAALLYWKLFSAQLHKPLQKSLTKLKTIGFLTFDCCCASQLFVLPQRTQWLMYIKCIYEDWRVIIRISDGCSITIVLYTSHLQWSPKNQVKILLWNSVENNHLSQLQNLINSTLIEDEPRYAYRGVMLDSSRHFLRSDH